VKTVSGNIVDVLNSEIFPGTLVVAGGKIADIIREEGRYENYIIPGFVDSHVHIESSMLVPAEFGRAAVVHGTVASVSDPHEIANVLGIDGVEYMIASGRSVPFKFYFGASSCVPATGFETSGAVLGPAEVGKLLQREEIRYLSEVMNYPGVVYGDPDVLSKIGLAKKLGKKVDGHAPGLRGEMLEKYVAAGISTDHETYDREEALEKIRLGMKILIREGSAARNFEALAGLISDHPDSCMFCSDDKHPDDLVRGHINETVKRALAKGIDRMKVLRCACVNPVLHYGLDVGLLRRGDHADFAVIDNFIGLNVLQTYIDGELVAENMRSFIPRVPADLLNNFKTQRRDVSEFRMPAAGDKVNIIEVIDGQLVTNRLQESPTVVGGLAVADPGRDMLKIAVVNRYEDAPAAVGFVRNFGLKEGAIAASMAHDSHNIIAVGVSDEEICQAVNAVISNNGGISAVSGEEKAVLPLPVAGLMSDADYVEVAERYTVIDGLAKSFGSGLRAPFMTLSFMALLVIPKLKLSDKGLFDAERFAFTDLFEKEKGRQERAVEMEEEAEYQRQLAVFVRSSTEKGIELVKIGEMVAALEERRSFLDIGAGGGDLTIPISQSFSETAVVEPNGKQASYLKRRCPHFTVYNENWERMVLGERRFDFVLCSHVLYYIEEGRWLGTIDKMYSCLEKGGRIAIVLQSPLGQVADFFRNFTRYDVNVLDLWRDLITKYGEEAVDVRYFTNEIWTDNIDDMVSIGLFLLLDRSFLKRKEEIRRYAGTRLKVEGGYRIAQDEVLLSVKKL
jgi:adenine deaminase